MYNGLTVPILLLKHNGEKYSPVSSVMPGYGPFLEMDAAIAELTSEFRGIDNVPVGYTFCLIENDKPVEYWFTEAGNPESIEKKVIVSEDDLPPIQVDSLWEKSGSGLKVKGTNNIVEDSTNGVSVGSGNTVSGEDAFAEGTNNKVSGNSSHVEGIENEASGVSSHAEGSKTTATGNNSHSEGNETLAAGENSHSEGDSNYIELKPFGLGNAKSYTGTIISDNIDSVDEILSTPEGIAALKLSYITDKDNIKVAITDATYESSERVLIFQTKETLSATQLKAEKSFFIAFNGATGKNAHAENSLAAGEGSHAEGINSFAGGKGSHSEGSLAQAKGEASHAEGYNTEATGKYSHAEGESIEGYKTSATGNSSHAEGQGTVAEGEASHAEGGGTRRSGMRTIRTQATGQYSHAEGNGSVASGMASHAEGSSSASGDLSHSEGQGNAQGVNSHSEGNGTSEGNCAHSEGSGYAMGNFSHAEGYETQTRNEGEHACGKYNMSLEGTLFSIGFGVSDYSRKNIIEVTENGDVFIQGLGKYNGQNRSSNTVKPIQKIINSNCFTINIFPVIRLDENASAVTQAITQTLGEDGIAKLHDDCETCFNNGMLPVIIIDESLVLQCVGFEDGIFMFHRGGTSIRFTGANIFEAAIFLSSSSLTYKLS